MRIVIDFPQVGRSYTEALPSTGLYGYTHVESVLFYGFYIESVVFYGFYVESVVFYGFYIESVVFYGCFTLYRIDSRSASRP